MRYEIHGSIPDHPDKKKRGWFLLPVAVKNKAHANQIIANLNVKFPSHQYKTVCYSMTTKGATL